MNSRCVKLVFMLDSLVVNILLLLYNILFSIFTSVILREVIILRVLGPGSDLNVLGPNNLVMPCWLTDYSEWMRKAPNITGLIFVPVL